MQARDTAFKNQVWEYYRAHGRDLPWRRTHDPYAVLVSEFMLQQTQVSRVMEKYPVFLKRFPTAAHVARARLGTVLRYWQGLGYNRRAKMLKRACEHIHKEHGGIVPQTLTELKTLPGVGESTAGAVLAFAFNKPHPFIETNIRRAYIHHYFPKKEQVGDEELREVVERTMDTQHPREWFWALMDYGATLPKHVGTNPNRKSAHYTRQSQFEGSHRQVRGAIIRALTEKAQTEKELATTTELSSDRITKALRDLTDEGFIKKKGNTYTLA